MRWHGRASFWQVARESFISGEGVGCSQCLPQCERHLSRLGIQACRLTVQVLAARKFHLWPAPIAEDCDSTFSFLWHLTWCMSIVKNDTDGLCKVGV